MEGEGPGVGVFIGLTIVLVGGAAVLSGRALAGNWKPWWQVIAAAFGLCIADRFLTFALFEGRLLDAGGFFLHFLIIAAIGLVSWKITHAANLVNQYPWKYERASIFTARLKTKTAS